MKNVLLFVVSFFLPPVTVAAKVGATKHLWINLVLCLLLYVPGLIHSWYVLFTK